MIYIYILINNQLHPFDTWTLRLMACEGACACPLKLASLAATWGSCCWNLERLASEALSTFEKKGAASLNPTKKI